MAHMATMPNKPDIFICHDGEQKPDIVDLLHMMCCAEQLRDPDNDGPGNSMHAFADLASSDMHAASR